MRLNIFPDGGVARLRVLRRGGGRLARVARRGADGRPRGDPQRRPRARRERHALRREGQHDHARPRQEHGRRMGDAPPARSRLRLGDRAASARRRHLEGRDRHESLQGQLSRERVARGLPRARSRARRPGVEPPWTGDPAARQAAPHHRHFFSKELRTRRPGLARPAEHLSRRRHQPAARLWKRGSAIDARRSRGRAPPAAAMLRLGALGRADDAPPAVRRAARPCCRRLATRGVRSTRADWHEAFTPPSEDRRPRMRCGARFRRNAGICPHGNRQASSGAHGGRARRARRSRNRDVRSAIRLHLHRLRDGQERARRCWRCCAQRLGNDPADEIRLAAEEQAKITDLRLLGR